MITTLYKVEVKFSDEIYDKFWHDPIKLDNPIMEASKGAIEAGSDTYAQEIYAIFKDKSEAVACEALIKAILKQLEEE